jgi:hypothetical protein
MLAFRLLGSEKLTDLNGDLQRRPQAFRKALMQLVDFRRSIHSQFVCHNAKCDGIHDAARFVDWARLSWFFGGSFEGFRFDAQDLTHRETDNPRADQHGTKFSLVSIPTKRQGRDVPTLAQLLGGEQDVEREGSICFLLASLQSPRRLPSGFRLHTRKQELLRAFLQELFSTQLAHK